MRAVLSPNIIKLRAQITQFNENFKMFFFGEANVGIYNKNKAYFDEYVQVISFMYA